MELVISKTVKKQRIMKKVNKRGSITNISNYRSN